MDIPRVPQVSDETTDVISVYTADVIPVHSNTHDLSIQKAQIRHAKPLPPPFKSSSRPPLPEPSPRAVDPEYANVALSVSEHSSMFASESSPMSSKFKSGTGQGKKYDLHMYLCNYDIVSQHII